MNKEYDKNLEEMRKYLEQKQKEKRETNKDNPIFKYQQELTKDQRRIKFDDGYQKTLFNIDKDEIEKQELKEEKVEKRTKKKKYEPYKKDNIIFYSMLILLPIVLSCFIISTHSLLLIKKPFNYICLILSIISFIVLIISIILKINHRDLSKTNAKFNKKLAITIPLISIINLVLIFILNKIEFFKHLDFFLSHKKLCVGLLFIAIFIVFIIFIIRLILKKKFKPNTRKVLINVFITYYISAFTFLIFTLYGPYNGFKEWLITTAMATMDHQNYCKWFYSDKEIEDVMSKNYIVESGESTDESLIKFKETTKYKNEYERQILEHEEGEQYKVIELEVAGMKAYLAAIYDSTSIKVEVTKDLRYQGEYVTKMAERNDALLAINGGGFMDPGGSSLGGTPTGVTISEGKIVTNNEYGKATTTGGIIGFKEDGTLMLLKNSDGKDALNKGVTNAVSWGPFLIVNGVSSKISGNGGWGIGARTAIGQRSDGVVLFLVVDSNASRTKGATMGDLTEIMERYGAVNASNLDGGTSSVMVLPKEIAKSEFNATCHDYFTQKYCAINDPIDSTGTHQTRYIATSIVVMDKSEE